MIKRVVVPEPDKCDFSTEVVKANKDIIWCIAFRTECKKGECLFLKDDMTIVADKEYQYDQASLFE
jgi:hypothetical protein